MGTGGRASAATAGLQSLGRQGPAPVFRGAGAASRLTVWLLSAIVDGFRPPMMATRQRLAMLAAAMAAVALLCATPADAQSLIHELKAGVQYHDPGDLWSGFRREPISADINLEAVLTPGIGLFGGTLRPAIGGAYNTEGGTSKAYIDARWQFEGPAGIFLGLGLGGAIHDGNIAPTDPGKKALGSRLLFHIPLELGVHLDDHNSVSFFFDHISNGYTQVFNEGLDAWGVRYGYRF